MNAPTSQTGSLKDPQYSDYITIQSQLQGLGSAYG